MLGEIYEHLLVLRYCNPPNYFLVLSRLSLKHDTIYPGFESFTLPAGTRPRGSNIWTPAPPLQKKTSVIPDADEAIIKLTDQTDMKGSDGNHHGI